MGGGTTYQMPETRGNAFDGATKKVDWDHARQIKEVPANELSGLHLHDWLRIRDSMGIEATRLLLDGLIGNEIMDNTDDQV